MHISSIISVGLSSRTKRKNTANGLVSLLNMDTDAQRRVADNGRVLTIHFFAAGTHEKSSTKIEFPSRRKLKQFRPHMQKAMGLDLTHRC